MNEDNALWAVVRAASGDLYLMNIISVFDEEGQPIVSTSLKETVMKQFMKGRLVLKALPAHEYAVSLGPSPEGGIVKRSFVTPLGTTLGSPPLYLKDVASIYFVEDMDESDKKVHQSYIEEAARTIEHARQAGGPSKETAGSPLMMPQMPPGMSMAQLAQMMRGQGPKP